MVNKLILFVLIPSLSFAQETPQPNFGNGIMASLIYGSLGAAMLFVCYKIFDFVSPIDFVKEIKDEHNSAAAILAGAFMIGLGIIIGSAIS